MKYILFILLISFTRIDAQKTAPLYTDIAWKDGYLDIHHISTGRGNAAFIIFPDGTTMLIDAGDLDTTAMNKVKPIKASPSKPNSTKTPAAWIVNYIKQVVPVKQQAIDYALITHYHPDHFGTVGKKTKISRRGNYKLSGITEVAELIPVRKLIDRGYDFPAPVKQSKKINYPTFLNYLEFIKSSGGKMAAEKLEAGSDQQIKMLINAASYSSFSVRNVKCNGTIWTGKGSETIEYLHADSMIDKAGFYPENPLSLAVKISYGKFDYYSGGDNTGLTQYDKPDWFDVETPIAKAVGKVEAMTLNHHGNRDATNAFFLQTLCPKVIVEQAWCSDHPGMEVAHRIVSNYWCNESKFLFATSMLNETKTVYGPWITDSYKSTDGHIMIRVTPGGEEYWVYVIRDDKAKLEVKKKFGPFMSN